MCRNYRVGEESLLKLFSFKCNYVLLRNRAVFINRYHTVVLALEAHKQAPRT